MKIDNCYEPTPRQLKYMWQVAREAGLASLEDIEARLGTPLEDATRAQVSRLIEQLRDEIGDIEF